MAAARAGLTNVETLEADGEALGTLAEGAFDAVISRLGLNSGVATRLAPWWVRANGGRHTWRCREAGSAGIRKWDQEG